MDQLTNSSGNRPASWPLAQLDWDLNYMPRTAGADVQLVEWYTSSISQIYPDQVGAAVAISNLVVHGSVGEGALSDQQAQIWLAVQVRSAGVNHVQLWRLSEDMALAKEFAEVTDGEDGGPSDVWGTGTQDMMIYNLTDTASVLAVCKEARVDQDISESGLWLALIPREA